MHIKPQKVESPLKTQQGDHEDHQARSTNTGSKKLSVLLLCDDNGEHPDALLDHIVAIRGLSKHHVYTFNPRWLISGCKCLDLDEFDVVVIHYSLASFSDYYLASHFREKLRRFHGLKIQFIQDDYRRIDEVAAVIRYMGIHILFTTYPKEQISKVWDETRLPGVVKISTLVGYIPDKLISLESPPLESRPIDIGYRGRQVPYWLGQFGQEKVWIGQGVSERAEKYGLRCNISWRENDRIYGKEWIKFISSCKAMLGTESGASITDFDGSVEMKVQEYLAKIPKADFFEVQREVLQPYEENVPIKVISTRMFEAIASRTGLILFPGEYSGILKPWIHYIPLKKDFSNMDEVVEKIRDIKFLKDMTERAYKDIVASGNHSYKWFIAGFDDIISRYGHHYGKKFKSRFWLSQIERAFNLKLRSLKLPILKLRTESSYFAVVYQYLIKIALFCIVAKRSLTNSLLKILLVRYLRDKKLRETIPLEQVSRELILFDLLKQIYLGLSKVNLPFSLSVEFSLERRMITFTSKRAEEHNPNDVVPLDYKNDEVGKRLLWEQLHMALKGGRIKRMTWDHSAIGVRIVYPISRFQCKHITILVGQSGIKSFDVLLKLFSRVKDESLEG